MNVSQLDLDALRRALEDHDPDREHFLRVADGSLWTFVFSEASDETRARHEEVRKGLGEEWVRVPSVTAQAAFEEIEDFVEEMSDPAARQALFLALERRGAFRNFREALLQLPEEHRRWRSLRREAAQKRLDAFLASLGVTPEPAPGEAG
jgi:hypothetical protein